MNPQSPADLNLSRFRAAFQTLEPEIASVRNEDLIPVRIHVPSAVVTVLGCADKLRFHRDGLVEALAGYDMTAYDNLETYALALSHANSMHDAATRPVEPVATLIGAVTAVRANLLGPLEFLAKRELIDPQLLARLRNTKSHRGLGFDVLAIAAMFRQNWEKLRGKSPVDERELDEAEALAERFITALGLRDQGEKGRIKASDTRARAYTLFVRRYHEVRRALLYYRYYEGDADRILASIFRGRGGRGKPKAIPSAEPANTTADAPVEQEGAANLEPFVREDENQ